MTTMMGGFEGVLWLIGGDGCDRRARRAAGEEKTRLYDVHVGKGWGAGIAQKALRSR